MVQAQWRSPFPGTQLNTKTTGNSSIISASSTATNRQIQYELLKAHEILIEIVTTLHEVLVKERILPQN